MAVNNDNGIAVADINAVRASNKNKNKIPITNIEPIKISSLTPSIAVSIKLAGRNKPSCMVTFSLFKVGFKS